MTDVLNTDPRISGLRANRAITSAQENSLHGNELGSVVAEMVASGRAPDLPDEMLAAQEGRRFAFGGSKPRKERPQIYKADEKVCAFGLIFLHADGRVSLGKIELAFDPTVLDYAEDAASQYASRLTHLTGFALESAVGQDASEDLIRYVLSGESGKAQTCSNMLWIYAGYLSGMIMIVNLDDEGKPICDEVWSLKQIEGATFEECLGSVSALLSDCAASHFAGE